MANWANMLSLAYQLQFAGVSSHSGDVLTGDQLLHIVPLVGKYGWCSIKGPLKD